MSDAVRIVNLYLDLEHQRQVDAAGSPVRDGERLKLFRGTQRVIIRGTLYATGTTAFEPPAGVSWYFGLDNTLQGADITVGADPVATLDADFNAVADWADVSVTAGKICWPINLATVPLGAKFSASTTSLDMYGELWMLSTSGQRTLLCQWPVTVSNVYCNYGSESPLAETLGAVLVKADGDDVVIYFPDGSPAHRYPKH